MQKWHKLGYVALAAVGLLGSAMVLSTMAAPSAEPSSIVILPFWSIQTGNDTEIRITDTSNGPKTEVGDGPFSVCVRLNYVCPGEGTSVGNRNCNELDEHRCLTHHETWTFNVSDRIRFAGGASLCPNDEGFLVVFAENENGQPISFNSLIASAHISNADGTVDAYDGLGFQSPYAANTVLPTSTGNGNGGLRFGVLTGSTIGINSVDGTPCVLGVALPPPAVCNLSGDYAAPPRILQSDFQAVDTAEGSTQLILLTLDITSGDLNDRTHVELRWWNERENAFSAGRNFWCWERIGLEQISGRFTEDGLNTDTGSLRITSADGGKSIIGAIRERNNESGEQKSSLRIMHTTGANPTVYFAE